LCCCHRDSHHHRHQRTNGCGPEYVTDTPCPATLIHNYFPFLFSPPSSLPPQKTSGLPHHPRQTSEIGPDGTDI
jgi:hypothetical protein